MMSSTFFQDYNQNTPITAGWLNDVNNAAYSPQGVVKKASQSAAAWVRFAVVGGIVTIEQSVYVQSVVRNSVGNYTITYTAPLTNANNNYNFSLGQAGVGFWIAETPGSVTVSFQNLSGVAIDPAAVGVTVFGTN
jgi:hypothetical protein